jgi:cytidylate kinase
MTQYVSVAIDGPAGAGKSTVAKALAEEIGATYLDTGAMYRAVGLHMLLKGVDPSDDAAVETELPSVAIDIRHVAGVQRVYLSGEDVSLAIRTARASAASSTVSAIPAVRERMVAMQRGIAQGRNVVMDGRDIGTNVLPDATLKVFLVADAAERARRRQAEMAARGENAPLKRILQDILERDRADSTRKASPLKKADDAVEIDSTHMTPDEIVRLCVDMLKARHAV